MNRTVPFRERMRADLVTRAIEIAGKVTWVIKDPLASRFFYFTQAEYLILRQTGRGLSFPQFVARIQQRVWPARVDRHEIEGFLRQARGAGLLNSAGPLQQEQPRRLRAPHPLAIRLPGITPDAPLDALYGLLRPLFSPVLLWLVLILGSLAIVTAFLKADELVADLPLAGSWLSAMNMPILFASIAGVKIIHELAHALTIRHYGGRCREMGVMLLALLPCLYCDVSDAWLLKRPYQRILVSAAGVIAELAIASIALFLFLWTEPGVLHSVCGTLLVVCSVSTLLINGNPLMRYDGYFILSDLTGIPNLASEARNVVSEFMIRLFWGRRVSHSGNRYSAWTQGALAGYAVSSAIYRIVIIGAILFGIDMLLRPKGMGLFSNILILWVVTSVAVQSVQTGRRFWSLRNEGSRPGRGLAIAGGLIGLVVLAGFIPIPDSVRVPGMVWANESEDVFVASEGRLLTAKPAGSVLETGDVIVELANPDLRRQLAEAELNLNVLRSRLAAVEATRNTDPQASSQIPALRDALNAAQQQRQLRFDAVQRLTVRSPTSGTLASPLPQPSDREDGRRVSLWEGSPLDQENRGAYLSQGTHLGTVIDKRNAIVICYVKQSDVLRIRQGANVKVLVVGDAEHRGAVSRIATAPLERVPETLAAGNVIPIDPLASTARQPLDTLYAVHVELRESDVTLPIRAPAQAKIIANSEGLWVRLLRIVQTTLFA